MHFLGGKLSPAPETGGIEVAGLDCRGDRAPRFGLVAAVAEPTLARQRDDIGVNLIDPYLGVGELQLSHPGSVQEPATSRKVVEGAAGRCMPPLVVILTEALRPDQVNS